MPITRVYDATALDRLGLPVWAAVTPLARDLTVHAGKGTCAAAARISAIMEALERVCAEAVDEARIEVASYRALRGQAVDAVLDPELCDLPFETSYSPDALCSWVRGYDLMSGGHTWVALDLVISPAQEGLCSGVETNGLAAGNVPVEATLHAVYELIERDAAAQDRFGRTYGEGDSFPALRLISNQDLPAVAAEWVAGLQGAGIHVTLQELTHDVGVPVYRAVLSDPSFPGREGQGTLFQGLGCDLDAELALTRAICEAVQAHTAVLVGARESFEGDAPPPTSAGRLIERLLGGSSVQPFSAVGASAPPANLEERLEIVLERLRRAGFERCVVVDLSRPELDVPVVRVLVPGAASPYGDSARRPALRLLRALV